MKINKERIIIDAGATKILQFCPTCNKNANYEENFQRIKGICEENKIVYQVKLCDKHAGATI